MHKHEPYDFIALGDITTDAFIRLKDAHLHTNLDKVKEELCFAFGAKLPYESVTVVPAVGNAANAAVAAARLGLRTALVTDQGDDMYGKEHLRHLRREKVSHEFVRTHLDKATNYHFVLWYHDERTILVRHEEYTHAMPNIGSPQWLYISSLGSDTLTYHKQIEKYLKLHPAIKLAFQPGTFQIKLGLKDLGYFYKRSEVCICNLEEAQTILGSKEPKAAKLAKEMHEAGPKIAVVTDGPRGAFVCDGTRVLFMPPYPDPKPPFERTGAGDAYASTFVAGLALGMPVEEAITWAPINSMSVVQKIGSQAGLLHHLDIEHYLDKAPKNYRPIEVKV